MTAARKGVQQIWENSPILHLSGVARPGHDLAARMDVTTVEASKPTPQVSQDPTLHGDRLHVARHEAVMEEGKSFLEHCKSSPTMTALNKVIEKLILVDRDFL